MSAATWPTCPLSAPLTTDGVCFSTGNLNPFRNRKLDRMRFAEREIHDFAFEFRAVADADDVHILLEARCDAMHGVGNQRARQTVHGAMFFAWRA